MKIYVASILAAAAFLSACGASACGARESSSPAHNEAAAGKPPAQPPAQTMPEVPQSASRPAAGAPIEFIFGGLTPDKGSISYKIKVNTDKPIEEVHLALKETDAAGKVVDQTTLIWQNIVRSTRQPIEQGKTYEAQAALDPAATGAQCSLKEVVFKDSTRWSAP